jgi:hypothetical protein
VKRLRDQAQGRCLVTAMLIVDDSGDFVARLAELDLNDEPMLRV